MKIILVLQDTKKYKKILNSDRHNNARKKLSKAQKVIRTYWYTCFRIFYWTKLKMAEMPGLPVRKFWFWFGSKSLVWFWFGKFSWFGFGFRTLENRGYPLIICFDSDLDIDTLHFGRKVEEIPSLLSIAGGIMQTFWDYLKLQDVHCFDVAWLRVSHLKIKRKDASN